MHQVDHFKCSLKKKDLLIINKMKIVTGAIILRNKKILLTRRKPGEALEGYWEFPSGKVEDGETLQLCLEREIYEELGASQIK